MEGLEDAMLLDKPTHVEGLPSALDDQEAGAGFHDCYIGGHPLGRQHQPPSRANMGTYFVRKIGKC